MRLYLNGMLLQAAAYTGPYSPTTAPLKIGYANAGIGSLKMDVEEVAVYRVALLPAEILQHAFLQPQIPAAIQQALETGTAAMAAGDWAAAGEAFRKMSELPDAEPAYRAMARIALARTLRNRGQPPAAVAQYAAVFDDAQSPQTLREFISDVLIYGNVFYRCAGGKFGGVQIHGGKDNLVDNNLFIDCKYAVSFSPWGQTRWLDRLADQRTKAIVAQGGVDITQPPHITRYPDLARMAETPGPQLPLAKCRRQLRRIHRAGPRRQRAHGQPRLPRRRGLCGRRAPRLYVVRRLARGHPLRLPPDPVPRDRPVPGREPGNLARPTRSHAAVCPGIMARKPN
jgi:hypothetical protein